MRIGLTHSGVLTGFLIAAACGTSPADSSSSSGTSGGVVANEYALTADLHTLWLAQAGWFRLAIVATAGNLPDAAAATEKIQQNHVAIANKLRQFIGNTSADQLTDLLDQHLHGALEVANALKTGNAEARKATWYANGHAIAALLVTANPQWKQTDWDALLHKHLDTLLAEMTARMQAQWQADAQAHEAVVAHNLALADALSAGLQLQYKTQIPQADLTPGNRQLHLALRDVWQTDVALTRVYLVSTLASLPDADQAATNLLAHQGKIADAMRPYYGDISSDQLTTLLQTQVQGAGIVLKTAKTGQTDAQQAAKNAWQGNADQIAVFLAKANPHLVLDDVKAKLRAHQTQFAGQTSARLQADWSGDAAAYELHMDDALKFADTLADAIHLQLATVVDQTQAQTPQ